MCGKTKRTKHANKEKKNLSICVSTEKQKRVRYFRGNLYGTFLMKTIYFKSGVVTQ